MAVAASVITSCIPPQIAWTQLSETIALDIPISDKDLIEFISEGSLRVIQYDSKEVAKVTALLLGNCLVSKLTTVISSHTCLFPRDIKGNETREIDVFFHGAFCLPGESKLLILAGAKPNGNSLVAELDGVIAQARNVFQLHKSELAQFDNETDKKKEEKEDLHSRIPELSAFDYGLAEQERMMQKPMATAETLVPLFPRAVCFPLGRKTNLDRISREAVSHGSASGWHSPREGEYQAFTLVDSESRKLAVLSWEPYLGLPAYPEVRWTVMQRLPGARRQPQLISPSRPAVDFNKALPTSVFGADGAETWLDALTNIQLEDSTFNERVSATRELLTEQGFEAIAWYQPFHVWSEKSWGIYIDAAKLDDLALTISSESKTLRSYCSPDYCAQLAFGLIYSHEFFHARVEASLSWLEVNTLGAKYLRYANNVYKHLSGTNEWLEESLANWSSWSWHQQFVHRLAESHQLDCVKLNQLVESLLDLSPPGYNNWRCGHQQSSWRRFTTQMVTGKAKITNGRLLPLESLLAENLPYDLQQADIPFFFVGKGVIADRLQAHPAVLNVPARKELKQALGYFKYVLKGGGKGSHEKWVGPDNRAFILPQRDPVSRNVFKTFLKHFNLDKTTYVHTIRPKL